jgi:anti-sigma regulatory factor (Ser/Thr protein kinase)
MGQELGRFDPANRVLDQVAELFSLRVRDDGPEILNLDQSLADKYHLSDVRDTRDPGIANQLISLL